MVSRNHRVRSVCISLCAALSCGCLLGAQGPTGDLAKPSVPTAVFPSASELAPLPSLPPPAEAFGPGAVPVEHWAVRAPAQDEGAAYDDASPWGDLAREIAASRPGVARLSPALRCAAGEIARFYVEKGGPPTESLRRFLVARCGATSPETAPYLYTLTGFPAPTDAQLVERALDGVRDYLRRQLLGDPPRALAIATARRDERVVVVAIIATDPVGMEPLARFVDAARNVTVQGTLRSPAADAVAIINRGDYGFAVCSNDPSVRLPKFSFTCSLDAGDRYAWAEVLVRRASRVMDESVADVLVYDGDLEQLEYRARVLEKPTEADTDARAALLAGINRVRLQGKLSPLALAAAQSDANGRLAGTLFDATLKSRGAEVDRIALGMLAGWNVEGTIRNGGLFLGLVSPAHHTGAWLDFALERPMGRHVLLDPDARRIAISTVGAASGQGLGAVVTTYDFFESPNHDADAGRVLNRLVQARKAIGRPALVPMAHVPVLEEESARVLAGATEPGAALYTSIQALAQQVIGARVHGYLVEANDLDRAPLPDELIAAPAGSVAIVVTHHHVKGAAWGQYVILCLYVDASGGVRSIET
jgi:hypothetical protein